MTILSKHTLLRIADAFSAVKGGLPDVTVSYWVFGDTKKLRGLRGSADLTVSRFNAAMRWFAENWPEGSDLPPELVAYRTPEEDAA